MVGTPSQICSSESATVLDGWIGMGGEQEFHHGFIAVHRCLLKRGVATTCHKIYSRATLEQHGNHFHLVGSSSGDKWRTSRCWICHIHADTFVEQTLNACYVAFSSEIH